MATSGVGWRLWLTWMIGNAVAWPFAFGVADKFDHVVPGWPDEASMLVVGLCVGTGQWMALATVEALPWWWALAFGTTWAVGLRPDGLSGLALLGGPLTAMAQLIALRPFRVRLAPWPLVLPLSTWAGVVVGHRVGAAVWAQRPSFALSVALGSLVGGSLLGLLSGGVLAWMLAGREAR